MFLNVYFSELSRRKDQRLIFSLLPSPPSKRGIIRDITLKAIITIEIFLLHISLVQFVTSHCDLVIRVVSMKING